jgi:hyperosmotically inducible protein
MKSLYKAVAALALIGSVAACDAISGKETAGQYVDDATITTRVRTAFAQDPVVKAREVGVETLRSEVQLSGFVRTNDEAVRAAQIAQNTPGVRAVRNNIQVRP